MTKEKEPTGNKVIDDIADFLQSAFDTSNVYISSNIDLVRRENSIKKVPAVKTSYESLLIGIERMNKEAKKMESCIKNQDIDGIITALQNYCRYQSQASTMSAAITSILNDAAGTEGAQTALYQTGQAKKGTDLIEKIEEMRGNVSFRDMFALWVAKNIAPAVNKISKALNSPYIMDEDCGFAILNTALNKIFGKMPDAQVGYDSSDKRHVDSDEGPKTKNKKR